MSSNKKPADWKDLGNVVRNAKELYLQQIAKNGGNFQSPSQSSYKSQHEKPETGAASQNPLPDIHHTNTMEQVKASSLLTSSEEKVVHMSLIDFKKSLSNNENSPAVGIDLGTTYSSISIYENQTKKVTIIKNEFGSKTTPSCVVVDNSGHILVGNYAKCITENITPSNRIYDAKRLIGRSFNDAVVQSDLQLWPFEVINERNSPKVRVAGKTFHPEQISAQILASLKKDAESYLLLPVTSCVVTVPAYFTDAQRQATRDAATIAGLDCLRIINEPTSAAIAYNHQVNIQSRKNILIFDLGGGTFDVSILKIDQNSIEVMAVGGDTHLGGADFDMKMVDYCLDHFRRETGIDLAQLKNSRDLLESSKATGSIHRLRIECESQKQSLTASRSVHVNLEAFYNGHNLDLRFSRDLFNQLNAESFQKCIQIMEGVLKDAGLSKKQIDDVVCVGGSSKIVKIRELLAQYFELSPPFRQSINAEEAVCYGAGLMAAMMSTVPIEKKSGDGLFNPIFCDVTPLNLGIKVYVDENDRDAQDFYVILPRNTRVPCGEMKRLVTPYDNCDALDISIYEGNGETTRENNLLGQFTLANLPQGTPEGEPVDVCINVNEEGILHVSAECPRNRAANQIVVSKLSMGLRREEVDRLCGTMEELFLTM